MSKGGTGVDFSGNVWNNGKLRGIMDFCPDVTGNWGDRTRVLDLSGSGWALISTGGDRWSAMIDKIGTAMPIWVDDDEFATGVDHVSASSIKPGEASGGRLWIMAPAGNSPANGAVFHTPASANATVTLECAAAGDPVTLASNEASTEWSSELANTTDVFPVIKVGQEISANKPLGVKVMKRRTVKLTLWHVARQKTDGSPDNPEIRITKQEAEDYLDLIFGPQVNVYWDVTVNGFQTPANVNWDTATGADFEVPTATDPVAGNEALDVGEEEPNVEQDKIASSNRTDANSNINAYIVGGCETFRPWTAEGGVLKPAFTATGIAHPEGRKVWINRTARNMDSGQLQAAKAEALRVLAHEVGHIMIGPGHPNINSGGAAPLPGTKHSDRLMWVPFPGQTTADARRRLLVKGEWDRIEEWLLNEENEGRL